MTSPLADFEIRAELGEGGSAVVYDARFAGRRVALKVLRAELALSEREKQRFVDEARRMVAVDHPGLVKLESAGVLPDGRPFLAMPFLEGRTLSRRLAEGPLVLAEAVSVFGVLARAVAALHDAGIVHRDIKPENILLVDDPAGPRPVLLDLGIARDVDGAASTTTVAGKIRGTPAYMAPERFFGTPASPLSDIYELGVTFYMMLVGRLPWGTAESVSDRLSPRGPDTFDRAIGAGLARAMLRALSTRPEARPPSARTFAEEIERAFAHPDVVFDRTTEAIVPLLSATPPALHTSSRRWRLLLAVPLLGATGAAAFGLSRSSAPPSTTASGSASPLAVTAPEAKVAEPMNAPSAAASPTNAVTPPIAATANAPPAPATAGPAPTARATRGRGDAVSAAASASANASRKAPSPAATPDPFLEDRK